MKDIERVLRSIDFSKLSKIKAPLLKKLLTERKLKEVYENQLLNLDELDQITAAKYEEWFYKTIRKGINSKD